MILVTATKRPREPTTEIVSRILKYGSYYMAHIIWGQWSGAWKFWNHVLTKWQQDVALRFSWNQLRLNQLLSPINKFILQKKLIHKHGLKENDLKWSTINKRSYKFQFYTEISWDLYRDESLIFVKFTPLPFIMVEIEDFNDVELLEVSLNHEH